MTAEELKRIDEQRREREDELVLLLLLILGWAAGQKPLSVKSVSDALIQFGASEVAMSMALAHLDAMTVYGTGRKDSAEALQRQYVSAAEEMIAAMILTFGGADGRTVEDKLLNAGYSRSDSNGLRLGAERQVTAASNAGIVMGAAEAGMPVRALRHLSVIDDATTNICQQRDGLTLAVDDPYWLTNWPSLHWNCRSVIEPITDRRAVLDSKLPSISPMAGFGIAPPTIVDVLRGNGQVA